MIIYKKKEHPLVVQNYKPLRKKLRRTALIDTLYVISAYDRYITGSKPFPANIKPAGDLLQRPIKWSLVSPWELETLIQESIINCQDTHLAQKSMKDPHHFGITLNSLKTLGNELDGINIQNHTIFFELFRMAHKQFHWESLTPHSIHLSRYFHIYSGPILSQFVQKIYGLTTRDLFFIGQLAYTYFNENNWRLGVPAVNISKTLKENLEKFLNRASLPYPVLKECLEYNHTLTPYYGWTYNPMRAKPIIEYGTPGTYFCCLPTMVFWKFTDGLYYDLVGMPGFDNAIGDAFQAFIGECFKRIGYERKILIYSEEKYLKGQRRTCDWILEDDDATVFVECKVKRMPLLAKIAIESLDAELDKTVGIVIQIYKSIEDFKKGLYPNIKYKGKPIYPVIVTLQDWYFFTDAPERLLEEKIEKRFKEEGIDLTLVKDHPYTICSSWDFEKSAVIMKHKGISDVWKEKLGDPKKRKWLLGTYCVEKYADLLESLSFDLFVGDLRATFQEVIDPVSTDF
jgi:hypothetical protein